MSSDNKHIVKAFLEAAQSQDVETMRTLMDPHAKVVEAASLPYAGEYEGVDGFLRLVRRVFTTFADIDVDIQNYIAEGDHVVVLATMSGKRKLDGESFEMPITEIWHVLNGRVIEIRPFYFDTQEVNRLASPD